MLNSNQIGRTNQQEQKSTHIYLYTYMYIYIYVRTHLYSHMSTHMYMHICIPIRFYTYTYIHMKRLYKTYIALFGSPKPGEIPQKRIPIESLDDRPNLHLLASTTPWRAPNRASHFGVLGGDVDRAPVKGNRYRYRCTCVHVDADIDYRCRCVVCDVGFRNQSRYC